MARAKINRSYSMELYEKQRLAMRWLYEQGFTIEEIREMSLGKIDEDSRAVMAKRKLTNIKYDLKTGEIVPIESEHWIHAPLSGSGFEDFFLKDKLPCCYFFTREKPRNWRREVARDSLYSLSVVQGICGRKCKDYSVNVLTFISKYDTMEVSKLNITKSKAKEQGRMATRTSAAND